jgi:ankyrin repeat protein
MHLAAEKGRHLRLRSLLSGNLNEFDECGQTALFLAASNGHLRCVTMLLDAKAGANVLSPNGGSSLMAASNYGHLAVVNALIEARADMNAVTDKGISVLHCACTNPDNHPIVAALIAAGVLVDVPGSHLPPITIATQFNAIESLKLLIAAGADVNCIGYNVPPLSIATMSGNLTAAKLLIDAKADVKSVNGFETSLFLAAQRGYVEMTKLYISAGADVNMRDQRNITCLGKVAATSLDGRWAREADTNNEKPIITDKYNATPVDFPAVFQVLVDAKADVHVRNPEGMTPLHVAAVNNNVEAVNALIAAGANVNDATDAGDTALVSAVRQGSIDLVAALIAAGADVNHRCTKINFNVMDIATAMDMEAVCTVLRQAGAKTTAELMFESSEIFRAACSGDVELVGKLGGTASMEEKNYALVFAINVDRLPISMVKCLLAAGADPDAKQCGVSMLMVACFKGDVDLARELIDAGADITVKDGAGKTALQHAAKNKHREIVTLLLAKVKELKNANK